MIRHCILFLSVCSLVASTPTQLPTPVPSALPTSIPTAATETTTTTTLAPTATTVAPTDPTTTASTTTGAPTTTPPTGAAPTEVAPSLAPTATASTTGATPPPTATTTTTTTRGTTTTLDNSTIANSLRCEGTCTGCQEGTYPVGGKTWCRCCSNEDVFTEYYANNPCSNANIGGGGGCNALQYMLSGETSSVFVFQGCLNNGYCQPTQGGNLLCAEYNYCNVLTGDVPQTSIPTVPATATTTQGTGPTPPPTPTQAPTPTVAPAPSAVPPTFKPTPQPSSVSPPNSSPTRNPTNNPTTRTTILSTTTTPPPTQPDGRTNAQRCEGSCTGCSQGTYSVGTEAWCRCCANEDANGAYYRNNPCTSANLGGRGGCGAIVNSSNNGGPLTTVFEFQGCVASGFCRIDNGSPLQVRCAQFNYCQSAQTNTEVMRSFIVTTRGPEGVQTTNKNGLSNDDIAIIVGVIAGVVGLLLIIGCIVLMLRYNRQKSATTVVARQPSTRTTTGSVGAVRRASNVRTTSIRTNSNTNITGSGRLNRSTKTVRTYSSHRVATNV